MSNYKQHCTKGPVNILYSDRQATHNSIVERKSFAPIVRVLKAQDADATLIAEAFNTLHETGFTPAELAAQVTELREALQGMRDYVDGKKGELSDPLGSMDEALENSQPLKG